MAPDFEKQLSERMEDASLDDVMPEFNKEVEWTRLSEKLQPQKKRILLPVWSLAASVALLIFAGWYWMKKASISQVTTVGTGVNKSLQSVKVEQPPVIKTPDTSKKETLAVKKPQTKNLPKEANKKYPLPPNDTSILITQNTPKPCDLTIPTPSDSNHFTNPVPVQKIKVVTTKKTRPHAVSIFDIENEDKQFIVNKAPSGTTANPILARMFLITSQDAVASGDQYYPLQGVLKK